MGILGWLFSPLDIPEVQVDDGLSAVPPSGHPDTPERLDDEVEGFEDRFGEDAQTEALGLAMDEEEDCDHPTDTDEETEDEEYSPFELEETEEEDEYLD